MTEDEYINGIYEAKEKLRDLDDIYWGRRGDFTKAEWYEYEQQRSELAAALDRAYQAEY